MFSLIALQDRLIERLETIEHNGIGRHRKRSRAAAYRDARQELRRQGFTAEQADAAVKDAREMAELILICG
jgi:virulence-associated protein VapD